MNLKALVPRIALPAFFRVESTNTHLTVTYKVSGEDKVLSAPLPDRPTLLDVVKQFPGVDLDRFPSLLKSGLGFFVLPRLWVLECRPVQMPAGFHGAKLTMDLQLSGDVKHWEKDFSVPTVQLAELLDVVMWVREVSKADRRAHG